MAGSLAVPAIYKKLYPGANKERYRKLLIYQPATFMISAILLAFSIIALRNNLYGNASADQADSITSSDQSPNLNQYDVLEVMKGNTVNINLNDNPTNVKLIGITLFESSNTGQNSCYQKQSSSKLSSYLNGKKVELESDDALVDKSNDNALLRYIRIDNNNVNEYMIASGYAKASSGVANYRYRDDFLAAQAQAKEENLGLWSGNLCKPPAPAKPAAQSATGSLIPNNSSISKKASHNKHAPVKSGSGHHDENESEEFKSREENNDVDSCKGLSILQLITLQNC